MRPLSIQSQRRDSGRKFAVDKTMGLEYGRAMFPQFASHASARTGFVAGALARANVRLPTLALILLAALLITHGGAG